jgi:hypothetical protein
VSLSIVAVGSWSAIPPCIPTQEAGLPPLTMEYATDAERRDRERAFAYLAGMRRVGSTAAPGTVRAACEEVAPGAGRTPPRANLARGRSGRTPARC